MKYLDGLRGAAALLVVFHHYILAFYPALFSPDAPLHLRKGWEDFASGSPINFFYNGNFAVCLFFALSGLVLSWKFFQHKDREIVSASALKRYTRLAIPVASSVLLAYVLLEFSLFYNQRAGLLSGSMWLAGFWQFKPNLFDALNQAFLGAFFENVFNYNMLLWTIAYEFLGSFLVFGFLAIFGKMKKRYLIYLIASLIFLQTYYLAFILGIFLSDIMANEKIFLRKLDKYKIWRPLLLLTGIFLGSYPSGRNVDGSMYGFMSNSFFADPGMFYRILGAFLILMVVLESSKLQKLFSHKYFLYLGDISFSMYLLHLAILGSFSSFVFLDLYNHMAYALASTLTFVLSLPVIFLVSQLSTKYIDKKAVNFSKDLYEKYFKA